MSPAERIPEIALSAAWHAGQIPENLLTVAGESIQVIHRGTWTHGLGPDFADALLLFNERELRSGSIEMHFETRGWHDHGHQVDPSYDSVILHVVARHDGSVTRLSNGAVAPVVEVSVPDIAHLPVAMLDWDRVGGAVCATRLTRTSPATLRNILHALGDLRLSARSAQVESFLLDLPPAEVLWSAMLSGLGYSRNQAPMKRLADKLPLATLEDLLHTRPPSQRFHVTLGLLLGLAGFLPLSATESHLLALTSTDVASVESAWRALGVPWHRDQLLASEWDFARTRPANHPLLRLHAAVALVHNVAAGGGLLATTLAMMRDDDPVARLREATSFGAVPGVGVDRAVEMLASGILPVMFAVASHTADEALTDDAAKLWERLPAPTATSVTKRAMGQVCGGTVLRGIGARGAQGLVHLDTALCLPRRCFDCPIAAAELSVND